jgi:CheY-like chemotaxis protein
MTQNKNAKRILLVDDDLDDRELFVEAFSFLEGSAEVETLEASEKLLHHLERAETLPDYIFLDLNMPRKSGKECLKEIQEDVRLKEIRVVIYSTSINPRDVAETYEDGAYCFIQKPNSFSELKKLIQKVVTSEVASFNLNEGFIFSSTSVR